MKQYQINKAYVALERLKKLSLPVREAYAVYMLSKQLQTNYEFEMEQERRLVEKHHGIINAMGEIRFNNENDLLAFQDEVQEIGNIEVAIDFSPVSIRFDSLGDAKITPSDIASMSDFVCFID